jgi:hypothetical protein
MLETLITEIHVSLEPKSNSDRSIVPINSYEVIQKALSKIKSDLFKANTQLANQMQQNLVQNENLTTIISNRPINNLELYKSTFAQLCQTSTAIFPHSIHNWFRQWSSLLFPTKILLYIIFWSARSVDRKATGKHVFYLIQFYNRSITHQYAIDARIFQLSFWHIVS